MQVLFPEPQLRELRQIAHAQDRPVSELIRNAVDFWLTRQSSPLGDEVRESPPAYHCGPIQVESERLRESAYEDRDRV